MLPLKREGSGVLHTVLTASPRVLYMHLADTLVECLVWLGALYTAETWTLTKANRQQF